MLQRHDTQNSSNESVSQDSGQENKPPELQDEASTPEQRARVVRSPTWTPGRRTAELGNVLQELALDVPEGLSGQGQTPDSSSSEGSPPKEQRNKNLAELLEERIGNNEGGRYAFEIYVDPENR